MTNDNDPIRQAYARYDSDPRVSGMYDFEAFRDAVLPLVEDWQVIEPSIARTEWAGDCAQIVCSCGDTVVLSDEAVTCECGREYRYLTRVEYRGGPTT